MNGNMGTPIPALAAHHSRRACHRELPPDSPATSTDISRAEAETEDDGDIDMDRMEYNRRVEFRRRIYFCFCFTYGDWPTYFISRIGPRLSSPPQILFPALISVLPGSTLILRGIVLEYLSAQPEIV